MASKLNVRSVHRLVRDAQAKDSEAIGLVIGGEPGAVAKLAAGLGRDAAPQTLHVLSAGAVEGFRASDILLVAPTDDDELLAFVKAARSARADLLVLAPPGAAAEAYAAARARGVFDDELVAADPFSAAWLPVVAGAVARTAGTRGPALARRLPVLRAAVVRRLVHRTALENGALGALVFVPGADMPVMTLNQIRMVLEIGSAYGQDPGQRLPEVLGVVGAGLGMRALARGVAGLVPVAGWAVKGAFGYAGTKALGRAAEKYFDSGMEPVGPVRVKGLLDKVAKRRKAVVV